MNTQPSRNSFSEGEFKQNFRLLYPYSKAISLADYAHNNLNEGNYEAARKGARIIRLVHQKTKTEVTIPILNDNLIALFEKYNYNIPKANEHVLNLYIKNILTDLS